MANKSLLLFLVTISFSTSSSAFASSLVNRGGERRVGGRTEIVNVESNQEIQDLGRFCVREYNLKFRGGVGGGGGRRAPLLSFSHVVKAEKQVVAGFKYYLRIATVDRSGSDRRRRRMYDAVVVVRPWAVKARDLISFAPASGYWN